MLKTNAMVNQSNSIVIDVGNKLDKNLSKANLLKAKLLNLLKTQKLVKSELGFLIADVKKTFFQPRYTFTKALIF